LEKGTLPELRFHFAEPNVRNFTRDTGLAQKGGKPTFSDPMVNGEVAPIPDIPASVKIAIQKTRLEYRDWEAP
jgi:hypothetical protein